MATRAKTRKPKATAKPVELQKPTAVHASPLEVAKFFNVSKWAVYRAIKAKKIEAVEVFGQYRIPWRVVLAMSPNALSQ